MAPKGPTACPQKGLYGRLAMGVEPAPPLRSEQARTGGSYPDAERAGHGPRARAGAAGRQGHQGHRSLTLRPSVSLCLDLREQPHVLPGTRRPRPSGCAR